MTPTQLDATSQCTAILKQPTRDVVSTATACNYGNAFHMKYRLRVPIGERKWVFTMDDWMYKQANQVLFNRTRMSKRGITLGHLTLIFTKQPLN